MGGGASSGGIEGILATTLMVGRAIAGVYRNPGMYRLQDFHSEKAPRLKSAKPPTFVFFGQEDDDDEDEEEDDGYEPPSPIEYEHMFSVEMNDETIYIEDVNVVNEEGWTALHASCMSFVAVPAATKIIDEIKRTGGSLDRMTLAGPGSFNKGWTPLHMACAYGVEPVVDKLINSGADVNTVNCYGYSPLLEACHRGYLGIIEKLIKAGANMTYIPDTRKSYSSPFQAAPPHCALGESARCGYSRIVSLILESDVDKDQVNELGWTPLHEACFYNRVDVVATLLKAGANTTKRTRSGAMPWHLSGLENIRNLLKDQGGPGAEPAEDDTINMIEILQEVTSGVSAADRKTMDEDEMMRRMLTQAGEEDPDEGKHNEEEDALFEMLKASMGDFGIEEDIQGADERMASMQEELFELEEQRRDLEAEIRQQAKQEEDEEAEAAAAADAKGVATPAAKKPQATDSSNPLLHSGPMLGNLPSIGPRGASPEAHGDAARDLDSALRMSEAQRGVLTNQELGALTSKDRALPKKAEDKKSKKKMKNRPEIPADLPPKFICQLSQQQMQQPVKSIYGHFYEKAVIMHWMEQQGRICPLTGAPLAEGDLTAQDDLQQEIVMWQLKRSAAPVVEIAQDAGGAPVSVGSQGGAGAKDDLYDF